MGGPQAVTVESTTFRVGQEVCVSYYARVAEVGAEHPHREGRVIRLETNAIPTGWIDPSQEGLTVTVVSQPLPTVPGMYYEHEEGEGQRHMGEYHTDGKRFYYLNARGNWCDVGWGAPSGDEQLHPLVETPF
jgi:hypothetical protein